ncbi:hypothetical protein IFR05_009200 [Cadophora sp. M221]|nr:hypothetical protein IFR05_009200 [Cadophora sp. M221]
MALPPAPCFKDQFPWESWPSGGCGFMKLHVFLAAACVVLPSLGVPSMGAARIMEKGMRVLKISILLGLIFFAVIIEFFPWIRVLNINPRPKSPQPDKSMKLNDRIEWSGAGYQPIFRKYLEYSRADHEHLATVNWLRTEYHGVFDDPIPSVLPGRMALRDAEVTFRVWHVSADGELVTSSPTVHWIYYDPVPGAVEPQSWEDTASSQLDTIPDLEHATQYSISDGNTFLHLSSSPISSKSQDIRISNRQLGITLSTKMETFPSEESPSAVRLGAQLEYPHGLQYGQLHSMSDNHSDLVQSKKSCGQLNLQSTEESGNRDSPGSRPTL